MILHQQLQPVIEAAAKQLFLSCRFLELKGKTIFFCEEDDGLIVTATVDGKGKFRIWQFVRELAPNEKITAKKRKTARGTIGYKREEEFLSFFAEATCTEESSAEVFSELISAYLAEKKKFKDNNRS